MARFAECFEFDRAGDLRAGTPEQRARILAEMDQFLVFGNPLHRTLQAVDRVINRQGVHYVNITFTTGLIGSANWMTIYLNHTHSPEIAAFYFWHELGHVVGIDVFNPQDRGEPWAESFVPWIYDGTPVDSPVWQRLEPAVQAILLP